MRRMALAWSSALALLTLSVVLVECSKDEGTGGPCQAAVAGSCLQPGAYCTAAGQCAACPGGLLNCDGINANLCETQGTTCGGGCSGCAAPSCCSAGACYLSGQQCGSSGLTCLNGSCGGSSICGNTTCDAPNCCYAGACYQPSQACGSSGLTCNSGTCGNATTCGNTACGSPSCCYNDHCFQNGQACGDGLTCDSGNCIAGLCGGAACPAPGCCHANVCYQDGQGCGTSGQTCSAGTCGSGPAWSCTMDPSGGPFSTVHSDGCRWKWSCPSEGEHELYCETISTKEHTCSCKRNGTEVSTFKSISICLYPSSTVAAQVNAECGWQLPLGP